MNTTKKEKGAIFIMPRSSKAWHGAEALWITAAGWASAAERLLGWAKVVTVDRVANPEEVLHYPLIKSKDRSNPMVRSRRYKKVAPMFLKQFVKDLRLWKQSLHWGIIQRENLAAKNVSFVWQQHDLFPGPGRQLADALRVPLITYVHAPVVWETKKWGVKRYLWGTFLENFVEKKNLQKSDLIACVSNEVAKKVISLGVEPAKVVISAMAVDQYLFQHDASKTTKLKSELGITDQFVIGWTGSFRSFHGLDLLVNAFQEVRRQHSSCILMLVGDGKERFEIETLVKTLKLNGSVIFTGRQPFTNIPHYVSLFDIAVVSARSSEGFHYSPLKLREYLVAGKPTLAPLAGEIPGKFIDRSEVLLYEAGNVNDLFLKIKELIDNKSLRDQLSREGRDKILANGTWDYELQKVVELLEAVKEEAT